MRRRNDDEAYAFATDSTKGCGGDIRLIAFITEPGGSSTAAVGPGHGAGGT